MFACERAVVVAGGSVTQLSHIWMGEGGAGGGGDEGDGGGAAP